MFQYAAARALTAAGDVVYLDTSFLKANTKNNDHFTARGFELAIFPNLKYKFLDNFRTRIAGPSTRTDRIWKGLLLPNFKTVGDNNAPPVPARRQTVYLDGYFQDYTRFSSAREALVHDFTMAQPGQASAEYLKKITADNNAVSIHVRRGDYLKPAVKSYHGVLDAAYYARAMAVMGHQIKAPHYYVFSDDTEWCQANLQPVGAKIEFVPTAALSWHDMALMGQCRHHIIANSSFSWWAAWLNPSNDKHVIAPENWFADAAANAQAKNLVPPEWIRL